MVVGFEPDAQAAAAAREQCAVLIEGDIEQPAIRAQLPHDRDAVLFADVLEHLRDPLSTLTFARTLLAPRGRVIVSLPNIAHWTGRRALLRGRFPYADHGLFDRTHLRFFTRSSAHALARDAGYAVVAERFATAPVPLEGLLRSRLGGTSQAPVASVAALRESLTTRFPELFALQVVLTLRPSGDVA